MLKQDTFSSSLIAANIGYTVLFEIKMIKDYMGTPLESRGFGWGAECQKLSIYCFTPALDHIGLFLRGKTVFIFHPLLLVNCLAPSALSNLKSCTNIHGGIGTGN